MRQFVVCVEAFDAWMSSNRLKMNADKSQLIWLGTKQQLDKLSVTELHVSLLSARVTSSFTAYDLRFLLDNQLTMKDHVAVLCLSCLWQLRQLRLVSSSLTSDTTKALVHAFVSSRLDYCNRLLYGVGDGLLKKLQAVLNAGARVVTGTTKVRQHLDGAS